MTGNDNANPVQLAGLAESAAETLYRLVSTVPLPGEDAAITHSLAAAVVVRKLEPALDHIARTLSSPAVRDALPHAARHLDVAAARIGTAAHMIRSAQPAVEASGPAARQPADFPESAQPAPVLAGLAESAAETLYRLVSTVPLPGEDAAITHSLAAAVVVRKLEPALDHIARTLSSPAVRDALPHAARHLDVAAAGIGTAARVIRSAQPAIEAGRRPGDFPEPAQPAPPANGRAGGSRPSGTRLQTTTSPRAPRTP